MLFFFCLCIYLYICIYIFSCALFLLMEDHEIIYCFYLRVNYESFGGFICFEVWFVLRLLLVISKCVNRWCRIMKRLLSLKWFVKVSLHAVGSFFQCVHFPWTRQLGSSKLFLKWVTSCELSRPQCDLNVLMSVSCCLNMRFLEDADYQE